MLGIFKKLLGPNKKLDMHELVKRGAIILDVRTEREFRSGHAKNSINIPLDKLANSISKLKKDKPIITCCASGMRSSTAKNILLNLGFTDVHNGGSWTSLQQKSK